MNVYYYSADNNYQVELYPTCFKNMTKQVIVTHKLNKKTLQVDTTELDTTESDSHTTLTWNGVGWKDIADGDPEYLQRRINSLESSYNTINLNVPNNISTYPEKMFALEISNATKLTNINYMGDMLDFKHQYPGTIKIRNNSNLTISGFQFQNVSGQLFDITDSSVSLTNITISGGQVSNPTAKNGTSLISYSYKVVSKDPIFQPHVSSGNPTPPPAPTPKPSPPTLNLTTVHIQSITYGVRGIISIDSAATVDITGLNIINCSGNYVGNDTGKPSEGNTPDANVGALWSPLTLLNTSATIMKSNFSKNNQKLTSGSAQAITAGNTTLTIQDVSFTMADEVINKINGYKTAKSGWPEYWNETHANYESWPMIRNFGNSTKESKFITITKCTWNTGSELSDVNFLYFFVDTLEYSNTDKFQSNTTISGCHRNPTFYSKSMTGINVPSINVYSNRGPKHGTYGGSTIPDGKTASTYIYDYDKVPNLKDNNDIMYTADFYMGNWSMGGYAANTWQNDQILHFKSANGNYGLSRDPRGQTNKGMELYYWNTPDNKDYPSGYKLALTGLICSSGNSVPGLSDNTCPTWDDYLTNIEKIKGTMQIYNYGDATKFCQGSCAGYNPNKCSRGHGDKCAAASPSQGCSGTSGYACPYWLRCTVKDNACAGLKDKTNCQCNCPKGGHWTGGSDGNRSRYGCSFNSPMPPY